MVLRIFFSAMVVRAWWDVGFFFKEGIALLEEEALGFFIEEEEAVVFLLEVMFLAPGYALLDFLVCCFVDAGLFLEEILLEDIFLAMLFLAKLFLAILFLAILFLAMFFFATGFLLLLLFFILSLETVLAILMQV